MTVLWRLILAFMLVEFVLFRERTFALKRKNKFLGYFTHGVAFFILMFIFTQKYLNMEWLDLGPSVGLNGYAAIAIIAVLHPIFDLMDRSDLAAAEQYNTVFFLAWQIISLLTLFIFFPILPLEMLSEKVFYTDKFFIVAIGCIFVAYFLMILLYFIKKDLKLEEFPIIDERYATMLFRVVLYLLLLAPGVWGFILGAGWIVLAVATKGVKVFDPCNIRITVGVPLTLLAAITTRILIF